MKAIVALSGGMDSATVLRRVLSEFSCDSILAVSFEYGSKHGRYEEPCFHALCNYYNVRGIRLNLTNAFAQFKSSLLQHGDTIPEGHYEEESMRQTVVPARNLIFAAFLTGLAASYSATTIWLGVHAGDHFIYPDCRPSFIEFLRPTIVAATDHFIDIRTPFLHDTKIEILKWGIVHNVPYDKTRTCYKDQVIACGKCGSCQERLAAFAALGIDDPISYESREILLKK